MKRLLLIALALFAATAARADSIERQVKAAYIYNFIRFVEWPAGKSTGDIRVCVAGPQSVVDDIRDELGDKKIGDRAIQVHGARRPEDADGCSVLYVASGDPDIVRRYVTAVARDQVLTITETEGFPTTGGLINFFVDQQTVHFAVNADLLADTRFKLSSQMLQFGTMVSKKGPQ
jgi:hypothetical protein